MRIFGILILLLLCSCAQTTSMLGPAVTVASTGNIYQAGLSVTINQALVHTTGEDAVEHVTKILYEWEKNNINNFSLEDIFNNDFYKGYFNNLLKLNPSIIHNELGGIC